MPKARLTFQPESFLAGRDEIERLVPDYYAKFSAMQDKACLDIDWARYTLLEEAGNLLYLTARTEEGDLVGFFLAVLGTHNHARQARCAFADGWYLAPMYRGGQAKGFFAAIEAGLLEREIPHLFMSCTLKYNLDVLYTRHGFTPCECIYYKYLDE